jgi:lipopolysaccharide/colanic/teichoic acid biosynthesis glycosyltransferase
VKRLLDVVIASLLILFLSPLLLVVSVWIKLTSRGPVLYKQKRIGRYGRPFAIFKFRTMYQGADRCGPSVTASDDDRITPVGRILRDNKIDELPQLFNVVRGEMSLVGPRPQVPRFVEHFEPELREIVLRVRPGITGSTSLYFRHEERLLTDQEDREGFYIRHILPVKLRMDADYVLARSLRADLGVLIETLRLFSLALLRRIFRLQSGEPYVIPWQEQGNPPAAAPTHFIPLERLDTKVHAIVGEAHNGNGKEHRLEPERREVSYDTGEEHRHRA